MAGQDPEKGEGGGSGDDEGPSSRSDHSDRYIRDKDEERSFLNDIGLKRLRIAISKIGDDKVEDLLFDALHEAHLNPEIRNIPDLFGEATRLLVDQRNAHPADTAIRDAEYRMMAMNAVVQRDWLYSAASVGIPAYDLIKAYAWAMKDIGATFGTPLGKLALDLPEYLLRTNKANPTTRPGLGGLRAVVGVFDAAMWIDRDVTWGKP